MLGLLAAPYSMDEDTQEMILRSLRPFCGPGDYIVTAAKAARELRKVDPGMGFNTFAQVAARSYDLVIVVPKADGTVGRPTFDLIRKAKDYGHHVVLYQPPPEGQKNPSLVNIMVDNEPTNGRYYAVWPAALGPKPKPKPEA
jgi:hypothetical protein